MPIINKGLHPLTEINPEIVRANSFSFMNRTDFDKSDISERQLSFPDNIERVFLINPGPSSRTNDGIDLRKRMDRTKQLNVLCGSAVSFIDSGAVDKLDVDAVVFNNPESAYETCFSEETDLSDIDVYIAQQCKPEVFDQLKATGANIIPFDAYIEGASYERDERNGTYTQIAIGYGAAVSAISIFSYLGHNNFEAIGWDGTKEYAQGLEHLNIPEDEANPFDNDVTEFGMLVTSNPDAVASIYLHGDGPTAKLLNAERGKPRTDFSVFEKVVAQAPNAQQLKR